ncbi:holin [Timonella sp. A28]|uniref:holin n=1 Tax=Timonella sp. A28 TaxID=3442640 RepID=UPI003EBD137A
MSKYANKKFWVDTVDRAVATTAQASVAVLTAGAASLVEVDFAGVAGVAGLAGVVSVLTSIAFRGQDTQEAQFDDMP